ncbi:MAG TPA: cysteine desulfurase family protein [Lachnospiraceae bacterium]|nr:cysteine desulfurase family protein [Lachnospiraceae bacterium]
MQIYLDNSATTRCFDSVRTLMSDIMDQSYGNPSSMHIVGIEAEQYIKSAKKTLSDILKVTEKEIYFTSGGTESDNLAIIGCALANRRAGMHLITNRTEHPAVLEPMKYLAEQGFNITYLDTYENGIINTTQLEEAITGETTLISIMQVNNEIGAVQPIEEISRLIKKKNPNTLLHVDGVQGFGKYRTYPKRIGIDLYSVSGHKIHGPKGVGVLYVNEKVKIHPILFGGGQQKGLRSGTENVPGIAGIAKAAEEIYRNFDEQTESLYALKKDFIEKLLQLEDVSINGVTQIYDSAPHIVSASFRGIRSEVLLHALEDRGIYVSSGSACASNKPAVSETLKAIGLAKELMDSTIRFSFSIETTKEELDYTISALQELLPVLRKYTRH